MNVALKIMKWAAHVIMALVLFVGFVDLAGARVVGQMMPTGPDDLATTQVTIKDWDITPQGIVVTVENYPTRFVILMSPVPDDLKSILHARQKVDVLIKKEAVDNLQNLKVIQVYKMTLEDGTKVFDVSQSVTTFNPADAEKLNRVYYRMVYIPVLYFVGVFLYPRVPAAYAEG